MSDSHLHSLTIAGILKPNELRKLTAFLKSRKRTSPPSDR